MNFLSNFLKVIKVKDEIAVSMDNIILDDNDCASDIIENCNMSVNNCNTSLNVSKSCENISIISDDDSSVCELPISVKHADCMKELPQLNYSSYSEEIQLIDFEELIDKSRGFEKKISDSITKFNNIISSDEIPDINKNLLNVDVVNENFKTNPENKLNEINLKKEYKDNAVENQIDMRNYSNILNVTKLEENNSIVHIRNLTDNENYNACNIHNNNDFQENQRDIDTKKDLLLKQVGFDVIFSKEAIENNFNKPLTTNNEIILHDRNGLNIDTDDDVLFNDPSDVIPLKEFKKQLNKSFVTTKFEVEDSEDNDGYNSSDFEFITESEAKFDLLNINYNKELKTINITAPNSATTESENKRFSEVYSNYLLQGNIYDRVTNSEEVPSWLNRQADVSKRDYRKNHSIPEGDEYLNLFQGENNPVLPLSDIIFLENKSTRPLPMNAQYEGIGFDLRLMRKGNEFEAEYADEAKESIKRILLEYPAENRKRRRFQM